MRSEPINTSDMATTRIPGALVVGMVLLATLPISAQSFEMNFFVAVEGPTWGAHRGAIEVSDSLCHDLGYAQGYGHLTWRAYLTGTVADGEGDQVARERIGEGPWYNFFGVEIAKDLDQLHSDENNLWARSAVTVTGEVAPESVLEIPWGSQLDGGDFSRDGPHLCFGVP